MNASLFFLLLSLFTLLSATIQTPVDFGYMGDCMVEAKISQEVHDIGRSCCKRLVVSAQKTLDTFDILRQLYCTFPTNGAFRRIADRFKLSNGVVGNLGPYACEMSDDGDTMTCHVKIIFENVSLQDKKKLFEMELEVFYINEPPPDALPDIRYFFLPCRAHVSLNPFEEKDI